MSKWRQFLTNNTVDCADIEVTSFQPRSRLVKVQGVKRVPRPKRQCQYAVAYRLGLYDPTTFDNSIANQREALKTRVLKSTPVPDTNKVRRFSTWLRDNHDVIFPHMRGIRSTPWDTYIKQCGSSPQVKLRLAEAKRALDVQGITQDVALPNHLVSKWTKVKAFVKVENNLYNSRLGAKVKGPRVVMNPCESFNVLCAPWAHAVSKRLRHVWSPRFSLIYSAGQRSVDIADALFPDDKRNISEDDVSAFDASTQSCMLKAIHQVFVRMGMPTAVRQLSCGMFKTRGRTNDFKFFRDGMVKSGVPWTSLGNTILTVTTHLYDFCMLNGVQSRRQLKSFLYSKNFVVVGQGDDMLATSHPGFAVPKWQDTMRDFGYKAEGLMRKHPTQAEFCSCHVVPFREGYNFVPKLGRIINKFGFFCNPPLSEDPHALLRGVCLGGIATSGGSPFLEAFYSSMCPTKGELTAKYVRSRRVEDWKLNFSKRTPNAQTHAFYLAKYYATIDTLYRVIDHLKRCVGGSRVQNDLVQLFLDRDTAAPSWLYHKQ